MIWNLNNNQNEQEKYGDITIKKTKKELIISFENNENLFTKKESFNWIHKGTHLGENIIKKMNEFQTEELIFQNVSYSSYDESQSDFIFNKIWKELFNETILFS